MDARRAPQGLHAEDRVALGLSASHLFYLVTFSLTGWAIISSRLPGFISVPVGVLLIGAGVALAWARLGGRPLDRWAWLFIAYQARPRKGLPSTVLAVDSPAAARGDDDLAGRVLVLPTRERVRGRTPGRAPGLGGGARKARRCVFFSYRGGTGKSALAAETAALLAASAPGRGDVPARVALLDLDIASSTLCIRLGIDGANLGDLVSAQQPDEATMERVLLRHESGVRVVLAPNPGLLMTDAYGGLIPRLAALLAYLDEQRFDVVLFDLHGVGGDLDGYVLEAVDEIYYVFTPTPCGVFDLYRGVASLRRAGHRAKLRLVLNHADATIDLAEVFADLGLAPVAEIPTLPAVSAAENSHVPASMDDSSMGEVLRDLALSVWPDALVGDDAWSGERVVAGAGAQPALRRR